MSRLLTAVAWHMVTCEELLSKCRLNQPGVSRTAAAVPTAKLAGTRQTQASGQDVAIMYYLFPTFIQSR